MPVKRDYDWFAVRRRYETSDASMAQVASEFGIPEGSVKARAKREGWKKLKNTKQSTKVATENNASNNASKDAFIEKQGHERLICGARKRQGDKSPCRQPAGWGTSHPGVGRCKLHCGSTPMSPPRGNKNAVITGEYESIVLEVLSDEDKEAWHKVNTEKIAQLDHEIRTTEIRERRMLQRIENLKQVLHTMVKYEEEQTTVQGADGEVRPAVVTKRTYESTLEQIQRIEEALTRVQAHKARLIKLKNEFEELELRKQELEKKYW